MLCKIHVRHAARASSRKNSCTRSQDGEEDPVSILPLRLSNDRGDTKRAHRNALMQLPKQHPRILQASQCNRVYGRSLSRVRWGRHGTGQTGCTSPIARLEEISLVARGLEALHLSPERRSRMPSSSRVAEVRVPVSEVVRGSWSRLAGGEGFAPRRFGATARTMLAGAKAALRSTAWGSGSRLLK